MLLSEAPAAAHWRCLSIEYRTLYIAKDLENIKVSPR